MIIEPQHDKNNKLTCAPSEDSDQPGYPPRLIRVFAVRLKKPKVLDYPLSGQRRFWSEWADAQADVCLRWAHKSFYWFCHAAAQLKGFRISIKHVLWVLIGLASVRNMTKLSLNHLQILICFSAVNVSGIGLLNILLVSYDWFLYNIWVTLNWLLNLNTSWTRTRYVALPGVLWWLGNKIVYFRGIWKQKKQNSWIRTRIVYWRHVKTTIIHQGQDRGD